MSQRQRSQTMRNKDGAPPLPNDEPNKKPPPPQRPSQLSEKDLASNNNNSSSNNFSSRPNSSNNDNGINTKKAAQSSSSASKPSASPENPGLQQQRSNRGSVRFSGLLGKNPSASNPRSDSLNSAILLSPKSQHQGIKRSPSLSGISSSGGASRLSRQGSARGSGSSGGNNNNNSSSKDQHQGRKGSGSSRRGSVVSRRSRSSTISAAKKTRHEKYQHDLLSFPQEGWRSQVRAIFYPGLRREELAIKALRGEDEENDKKKEAEEEKEKEKKEKQQKEKEEKEADEKKKKKDSSNNNTNTSGDGESEDKNEDGTNKDKINKENSGLVSPIEIVTTPPEQSNNGPLTDGGEQNVSSPNLILSDMSVFSAKTDDLKPDDSTIVTRDRKLTPMFVDIDEDFDNPNADEKKNKNDSSNSSSPAPPILTSPTMKNEGGDDSTNNNSNKDKDKKKDPLSSPAPSPPQSILKKPSSTSSSFTGGSTKMTAMSNPHQQQRPRRLKIGDTMFDIEDLAPLHPIIAHWFENMMYGVIIINLVILASSDPYELRADAKRNRNELTEQQLSNLVVALALFFEQIIFGIAQGFQKFLKIRSMIQFLIVLGITIAVIVDVSGAYPNRYFGGSVILVLRLIKPLQHFAVFERLTVLTDAITGTISKLFDVTFLFMLFLVVASVACQSFLGGSLLHRCVNDDYWNQTILGSWNLSSDAIAEEQPMLDFVCGGDYDIHLANQYWTLNSTTMQLNQTTRYCNNHADMYDKFSEVVRREIYNATTNTTRIVYDTIVECLAPPPAPETAPLFRKDGSSAACSPDQVCDPGRQRFLGVSFGYRCPFRYQCERVINPRNGWAGFDNFGMAVQSMFVSATWQLWFDLAMGAANATNLSLIFFFIVFVWFADMLTGMIVVKISLAFEQSSQKAQRAWHDLREKKKEDERKRKALTGIRDASVFSSVKSLTAALVIQKKKEDEMKEKEQMSLDTYLNRGGIQANLKKELEDGDDSNNNNNADGTASKKRSASVIIVPPASHSAKNEISPSPQQSALGSSIGRASTSPAPSSLTRKTYGQGLAKLKRAAFNVGQQALQERQKRVREAEMKQKPFLDRTWMCIAGALNDLEIKLRPFRMNLARNMLCTKPYFFFIAFVNTINVIVIATYQKSMNKYLEIIYVYGDLTCLIILTLDCILRLFIMFPTVFFKSSKKNGLDFVVTILSWIDTILDVQNMKAFRILRAFRPIELLAYSPNLFKWVKFAMVAVESSPVVLFVLFCIIVVFALAGMQLFGGTFCGFGAGEDLFVPDDAEGRCGDEGPRPRPHFDDFGHALLTSFQIVTGDNWDDIMFNAMTMRGWWMGAYFSVYFFFASYMMIALLNGIIFSSFAHQSLKEDVAKKARLRSNTVTASAAGGAATTTASGGRRTSLTPQRRGSSSTPKPDQNIPGVEKSAIEKELDEIELKNAQEESKDAAEKNNNDTTTVTINNPNSPSSQLVGFNLVGVAEFAQTHLAGKGVQLSMFKKAKEYFDGEEINSNDGLSGEDSDDSSDSDSSSSGSDEKKKKINKVSDGKKSTETMNNKKKTKQTEEEKKVKKSSSSPTKKNKRGNNKNKNKKGGSAASPQKKFNTDDLDALFGEDRKRTWREFRFEVLQPIARHKWTENFILLVILVSIVANILTVPTFAPDSPAANLAINLELVTRGLFTVEAIFMISAYGFDPRDPDSYLRRTNWNIFEFAITIANIVSIFLTFFVESTHWSVLFFSTFIAIRPLRIVRRSASMSLVLRALFNALIAMRYAVVAIFILIFLYAIAGTQVFAGKFDRCFQNISLSEKECEARGFEFNNPLPSFDNAFESLFSVFIILTLELWSELMYTAMDITSRGEAPSPNANPFAAFYFVFFAVIGGWFCVSIFMSVLVDSYNRCKRTEAAQRSILTDREQNGWLKSSTYLLRALPNHALLHENRHPSLFSNIRNNTVISGEEDDSDQERNDEMADLLLNQDDLDDDELALAIAKRRQEKEEKEINGSNNNNKRRPVVLTGNIDDDLEELLMDLGSPQNDSSNNNNNNDDSSSSPKSGNKDSKKKKGGSSSSPKNANGEEVGFLGLVVLKIRGIYGDFTAALDRSPTYRHVQKQFGDIVRAPWFVLACNFISIANFILLCLQISPTPDLYGQILETLQDVLAVLFGVEAFCKILGESFAVYIASKWNKFDFFVAVTSIAGLIFRNTIDSRVRSAVWSLRLIRIVKIFRGRKTLATLVSHFGVALMSLSGVFSIILIFYFAFAVFSAQLFGRVVWEEEVTGGHSSISRNANFATVPMAMYTLVRISFMGDWPRLFWGLTNDAPGCDNDLGNCGPGTPIPQVFFVVSIIFFTYVCRNLVLAVLIDSFSSAGDIRSIQKWQAKAIVRAWRMYDPEFTGVMRGFDVIHVLRRIPVWCTLGFRHFNHTQRIQLETAFLTLLNIDDPNANNFNFIQKRREEAKARLQSVSALMGGTTTVGEDGNNPSPTSGGGRMTQKDVDDALAGGNTNKKGKKNKKGGKNKNATADPPSSPSNNNNTRTSSSPTSRTAASSAFSPPSSPLMNKTNNSNNRTSSPFSSPSSPTKQQFPSANDYDPTSPVMSPTSAKDRRRLSHGGVTFENFVDVLCHMAFNCPAPSKRALKMHRMYEKDHVHVSKDPLEEPDELAYENAVRIIFNAAMKRLVARRRKRLRAASFAKKKARMEAAFPDRFKKRRNNNGDDNDSDFDQMGDAEMFAGGNGESGGRKKIVSHSSNAAEELASKVMSGGVTIGETFGWLVNKVKGFAKTMTTDYTRPTEKDEFGVALSDDDDDEEEQRKIALDAAFDEEQVKEDIALKIETAQYEGWDYCEDGIFSTKRAKTTKDAVTHAWFSMQGDEGLKLLQGTPPPDDPLDDEELLPMSRKDFAAFSMI